MSLSQRDRFVDAALSCVGNRYSIGGCRCDSCGYKDCSGLVCFSANAAGYPLPCVSSFYIATLGHQHRTGMAIATALRTRGALLLKGPNEGMGPSQRANGSDGHVVICLGDGRLIEARGHAYGVLVDGYRPIFNYAMTLPGMTGFDVAPGTNPGPSTPMEARAMGMTAGKLVPGSHPQTSGPFRGRFPFIAAILNGDGTTELAGFNGAIIAGGKSYLGMSIYPLGHLAQPIEDGQFIDRQTFVGLAGDGGTFHVNVTAVYS